MRELRIVTGNANPELARAICRELDTELGALEVGRFSDGEIQVTINESIRGLDVFVVQSTCPPVNENLMELLIIVDALRRASARQINLVIPYYGYARQDKKVAPREPISARLVANLIEVAGADRVLSMDLHSPAIQGFFNFPVDHLTAQNLFIEVIEKEIIAGRGVSLEDIVIVSPDVNGVARASRVSSKLNCDLAIVAKQRPKPNVSEVLEVIGEVKGRVAILVDDMIDTAGSVVGAADALGERGVEEVYVFATHGLFSGPAITRLSDHQLITEVHVTDTIPLSEEKKIPKIIQHSTASLFAEAIRRCFEHQSISSLFR